MEKYKKDDYIAVMTNQPDIHFMEMFGHGLSIDDVEPSEYVAKIKSVIDDDNYLIFIVHPTTYKSRSNEDTICIRSPFGVCR